jgi:hypothetical protein
MTRNHLIPPPSAAAHHLTHHPYPTKDTPLKEEA